MSVLTNVGKAYLASLLKPQDWYVGWGEGVSWWDSAQTEVFQFTAGAFQLSKTKVQSVVIKTLDDVTTYVAPTNYTFTAGGALTRVGGAMSDGVDYRAFYFAQRPDPVESQDELVAFLGLLEATVVEYVEPDVAGDIHTAGGDRWTISVDPTQYIYVKAAYDYLDENTKTIRELAIYHNATPDGGLPGGQTYFPLADLTDIGEIINIENIPPVVRSAVSAGSFNMVVRLGT